MDDDELAGMLAPYVTDGAPGFAAGVYRDGALVASACAGLAVLEHGVPIGIDTVFDIASASKHFTAACLVLLERDGLLRLDDDVRLHLPELSLSTAVTLRQCLSHTGGLREYYSLCDLAGVPIAGMTERRLMRLIAGMSDVDFTPGTGWAYSNTGFVLAAATLRRLTGRSLAEFATERIFVPLGMAVTRFRDDLAVPVPAIATGYTPAPGTGAQAAEVGRWRRVDLTEEVVGDGAVITTIRELATWQHFMLTGAVLGTEVRDALLQAQTLADGRRVPYALGLATTTVGGRPVHLHSGSLGGFRSALAYLIGDGVGIAVLANRDDVAPARIAIRIAERLTGCPPVDPPTRLERAPAVAAQPALAGRWHEPALDVYVTLDAQDDGTLTQTDGEAWVSRFAAMSDGTWHGIAGMVSIRYRRVGDELWCEELVGDGAPEVFTRVGTPPATVRLPTGAYHSQELRAFATVAGTDDGSATVAIGLAGARTVTAVSDGVWAGEGITLRFTGGGNTLLISEYGALRVRFDRIAGPAPHIQRGL